MNKLDEFSYSLSLEECLSFIENDKINIDNKLFTKLEYKIIPVQVGGKFIKGIYSTDNILYEFYYKEDWNSEKEWYFKNCFLREVVKLEYIKNNNVYSKYFYNRELEAPGKRTYMKPASYQSK